MYTHVGCSTNFTEVSIMRAKIVLDNSAFDIIGSYLHTLTTNFARLKVSFDVSQRFDTVV